MNAIIYCRVSSREQVEGTSLESQQLACEEYARTRHLRVLRVFVEQGESAKFADRTELLALIDYCRANKGQISALIVWKLDRFARNVSDHFNLKSILQKYGVNIVSVTEPIDTNPEGKLMETILAGFAQFDNDIRAARTVQGMRRKIQEGIFPWKPPLGYKSTRLGREKKTKPDQPDHPRFGLLQKAWQELATGAYTKVEIRRLMENWGIVTRKGSVLSGQSIDNLFRNPFYAGILIDPWSGEEHQGLHVPMVSREVFACIQQLTKRSQSVSHQKHRDEFPLRGLIRCGECGRYLTASFARGRSKRYPYYHCHSVNCDRRGKGIPAEHAHREFIDYLPFIAPKTELLGKLGDLAAKSALNRDQAARAKQSQTKKALERANQEIRELVTMRAQRLISDEEFNAHRTALLERRYAIEALPKHAQFSAAEIRNRLGEIAAPLYALFDTWKALLPHIRFRFQRLIFPVGFITSRIRTAELGLLFKTISGLMQGESSAVPLTGEEWNQLYKELLEFQRMLSGEAGLQRPSKRYVRRKTKR